MHRLTVFALVACAFSLGYYWKTPVASPSPTSAESKSSVKLVSVSSHARSARAIEVKTDVVTALKPELPHPEQTAMPRNSFLQTDLSNASAMDLIKSCREFEGKWREAHVDSRSTRKMTAIDEQEAPVIKEIKDTLAMQRRISDYWAAQTTFKIGPAQIQADLVIRMQGFPENRDPCNSLTSWFLIDGERVANSGMGECGLKFIGNSPIISEATYYDPELEPILSAMIIHLPMPNTPGRLEYLPRGQDDWQTAPELSWRPVTESETMEIAQRYLEIRNKSRGPASEN